MDSDSEPECIPFVSSSYEKFSLNEQLPDQIKLVFYIFDTVKNFNSDSLYVETRTIEQILLHEEITYIDIDLVNPFGDIEAYKENDVIKYIKKLKSINSSLKISFLSPEYDDSDENTDLCILFEYKDYMIQLEINIFDDYHQEGLKTEDIDYLIKYIKNPNMKFDKSKLENKYGSVEKEVDKILNKKIDDIQVDEDEEDRIDREEIKPYLLAIYLRQLKGFRLEGKILKEDIDWVKNNIKNFNLSSIYKYNLSKI
jgi:hypothetical protein